MEILVVGCVFAAGLIVGALLFHLFSSGSRKADAQLRGQLEALQSGHAEYQQQVSEHFAETAQLVNQLTESYKAVHQHLAAGAKELGEGQAGPVMHDLIEEARSPAQPLIEQPQDQPKDYAPKKDPNADGEIASRVKEAAEEV